MELRQLNNVFEEARAVNARYIGMVLIPTGETIIFNNEVFDYKQEYINDNYNSELQLKHAKHVQIVACDYGRSFHDLQVKLKR